MSTITADNDEKSGGGGSPLPRTQSGVIPLTSSSTIVKTSPASFARPEEVWREILKTAYGRDKAFVSLLISDLPYSSVLEWEAECLF